MKKIYSLFYLFFCLTFQNIQAQDSQSELFDKIEIAFNSEEYEEIINNKSEIFTKIKANPDSVSAELLYFLGDAYLALDSLDAALDIMVKELEVRKKLPYSDPLLIADMHFNLAFYLQLNDQFEESKENFSSASNLYKENLGLEIPAYIESQIELAKVEGILGNRQKSLQILEDLKNIEFDKTDYQHVVNKELGMLYFDRGYYTKAENLLTKNLEYIEGKFGKETIEYAEALVTLAIPHYYRSQYAESELLYKQALEIISRISGSERLEEATKNNLALLYYKIGLYDESLEIFQNIIDDETSIHNANKMGNYARNLTTDNQQEKAIIYFDRSINMIKEILGTDSELYIRALKEKALALQSNNNTSEYYSLMNESYTASKRILDEDNPEFSKYELNWGIANFRMNDIKQAEKHIKKAHELRNKYLNKNHPLYAETSKELAELNWFKGSPEEAKFYFKSTFDNYFSQIAAYFPALSEQQKANFYTNTLRSTFEEFNSFAIAYHSDDAALLGDMYNYQLATKGLIMYATAKARKNILNSNDEALITKYQDWISTKELISQLYSMSEKEIEVQELKLDSLNEISNKLEKELSRASSDFSEAYNSKDINWKDVQAQLKDDEAAIEMIRYREFLPDSSGLFQNKINYAALLIDKNSTQPELILFENGLELENKYINNYRNAIRYKVKDGYSYKYFWKPIAEKTKDYNKLYFSPDGIYNQISINVLFNTKTEKYVLEEQNIQLLTNTKDLIAFGEKKSNSNVASNPTLFGFPNYNKGITESTEDVASTATDIVENATLNRGLRGNLQRYIRGNSLVTALPGTKEEVDQIGLIYKNEGVDQAKTFLENDADEIQLKAVNNPKVLHVATHGFFLEDNETTGSEEDKYSDNPLLKSGLIMAGANSFISTGLDKGIKQDGILTAYEAMNLNLTDTELVVLSACETGLGELRNGEGVYGLRRAFQVAGADALIMSLWSVDDAATQELMTTFYQNWLSGQSKLKAFNEAQKSIKAKYKHPFYWGAFVMVGE